MNPGSLLCWAHLDFPLRGHNEGKAPGHNHDKLLWTLWPVLSKRWMGRLQTCDYLSYLIICNCFIKTIDGLQRENGFTPVSSCMFVLNVIPCYLQVFFQVLSFFSLTFHHWNVLSNLPVRIVPDVDVVWVSEFDLVVAVPAQQLIHSVLSKALLGDKREDPAKQC